MEEEGVQSWAEWAKEVGSRTWGQAEAVGLSLYYRCRLGTGDRRGGARQLVSSVADRAKALVSESGKELAPTRTILKSLLVHLLLVTAFVVGEILGSALLARLLPGLSLASFLLLAVTGLIGLSRAAEEPSSQRLLGPSPLAAQASAALLSGALVGGLCPGAWSASALLLLLLPACLCVTAILCGDWHPHLYSLASAFVALSLCLASRPAALSFPSAPLLLVHVGLFDAAFRLLVTAPAKRSPTAALLRVALLAHILSKPLLA